MSEARELAGKLLTICRAGSNQQETGRYLAAQLLQAGVTRAEGLACVESLIAGVPGEVPWVCDDHHFDPHA